MVALLPRNLQSLANVCRTDGHLWQGGVRLITTDGGYRAEATDGRRLARVVAEYPNKPEDYPVIAALDSAPNGQHETTIPADAWKAAFKAIPKQKRRNSKPILENVAVVQGEKVTSLASTTSFTQPENLTGRWPDTDRVIPDWPAVASVRVNAKALAELLSVAGNFADENFTVTLHVHAKDAPIKLTASDPSKGQEFVGLLMPLSD
jgi:DNA polymerase III sliding clamp (beta) subunit (PCNA family)